MIQTVIYQSAFYNFSGYAAESRGFVKVLAESGFTVRISSLGKEIPSILPIEEYALLKRLEETPADLSSSVFILAHSPLGVKRPPGSPCAILRTMYETDRIHPEWVEACDRFDEVWVPSFQNRDAFVDSGLAPEKVRVIRGGIDTAVFRPGVQPYPLARRHGFAFLSVFDWQWRKGWDHLVAAYCEEFRPDDLVTLYLKADYPGGRQGALVSELQYFVRTVLGRTPEATPDIVLIDLRLTDPAMASLYNAVDAFVLPTRGEGYNRPFLEAMACGLPVIGTGWGGQTDFLTPDCGYPIPSSGFQAVPEYEPREWYRGLRWAAPDRSALRRLMRHVYENREEARRRGEAARAVAEAWDLRRAGEEMAGAVRRLMAERGGVRGNVDPA